MTVVFHLPPSLFGFLLFRFIYLFTIIPTDYILTTTMTSLDWLSPNKLCILSVGGNVLIVFPFAIVSHCKDYFVLGA